MCNFQVLASFGHLRLLDNAKVHPQKRFSPQFMFTHGRATYYVKSAIFVFATVRQEDLKCRICFIKISNYAV